MSSTVGESAPCLIGWKCPHGSDGDEDRCPEAEPIYTKEKT